MVNLRPDGDGETEFVSIDRPRIHRVLARIAADLNRSADEIYMVSYLRHVDFTWASV